MTVGQRIHDRRLEIGLSVDKLAEKIGKNRATVYRYENNDIENLPLSIIEELSLALKTTPAYLMGWEPEQDKWTKSFCKSVEKIIALDVYDKTDYAEATVDYSRISEIADGVNHIYLSEACEVADMFGFSLDLMVGLGTASDVDENTPEFVELYHQLSREQQSLIISQIKGILSNQ